MEKIHENMHVLYMKVRKHECFYVFSPFSAYFSPHYIVVEKGLLSCGLQSGNLSALLLVAKQEVGKYHPNGHLKITAVSFYPKLYLGETQNVSARAGPSSGVPKRTEI